MPPAPAEGAHRAIGALPLFHSFGQTVIQNGMISTGGSFTLLARFTPEEAFEVIERDRLTIFAGVPTMYFALLHYEGDRAYDVSSLKIAIHAAALQIGKNLLLRAELHDWRRADARGGHGCFRREVQRRHPGRLRPLRDVADRELHRPEQAPEDRLDRLSSVGRRDVHRRRRGQPPARRRTRRDLHPRPQHHEGILEPARRERRDPQERLVPLGRHRLPRRRRMLFHRRPEEGHDPARRLQRVPARGRRGSLRTRGRRRGRGHRRAP